MKLAFSIFSSFLVFASYLSAAEESPADWKHAGAIWLITTAEGAELPAETVVENFPALVTLHKDWFDFSAAQKNGADVRFAASDGTVLSHEIEDWNADEGIARIWVRVPKIAGQAKQELRVRWGNAKAENASDGKAVFNSSNGYLAVWHMNDSVRDVTGNFESTDTGTTPAEGPIGAARRFADKKGIFCGDKLTNLPSGAQPHTTEAWFRAEQSNPTLIGWGNEGGGHGTKIQMKLQSPPHIRIDSFFADVKGKAPVTMRAWNHIVHTYERENSRLYLNGAFDAATKPLLQIKSPGRLWLGGWYHNYDFLGELDEVRISTVARSAEWIKLQYENQRPHQRLVGPLVKPGDRFTVSHETVEVREGDKLELTAQAEGAIKTYWLRGEGEKAEIAASDRASLTFNAPRVSSERLKSTITFKAIYPNETKTKSIAIDTIEHLPDPKISLSAPKMWNGREPLKIKAVIENLAELDAKKVGKTNFRWEISGFAVTHEEQGETLVLKRAHRSGELKVIARAENGGSVVERSVKMPVTLPEKDDWVQAPTPEDEHPVDGRFYARNPWNDGERARNPWNVSELRYSGKLDSPGDRVFLRVFAGDRLFAERKKFLDASRRYSFTISLDAKLVTYRTEFGVLEGDRETILHKASDLVCGDAFLLNGQSNTVATDVGPEDPKFTSEWIRSFGSTTGDPKAITRDGWGRAVVRSREGGKHQIGAWGMELAKRLVESEKVPICIINGAVGGTRIDQHQRNEENPVDPNTIYGRLLARTQAARLTHGVRAVFWHQGENDQGADGPSGRFGRETYRDDFHRMAGAWHEDYPNIQRLFMFQIWPKACAMGINGSDDRLREVQRKLPQDFRHMSIMSTLGVEPPGGCHYPLAGYEKIAALIEPLVKRDLYGKKYEEVISPANLIRASFASNDRKQIMLEFDSEVKWNDAAIDQFFIGGKGKTVEGGAELGKKLLLILNEAPEEATITYVRGDAWKQANILRGPSGIAVLTFADVPISDGP